MKVELLNKVMEINFKWDMNEKEFADLMSPPPGSHIDVVTYDGAVFFGDFKLEFMKNDVAGTYCNFFQINGENPYEWLRDGTPYSELYPQCDEFKIVHRRTFEKFAKNIERQILSFLERNPEYILGAIAMTEPGRWYPNGQGYTVKTFSRIA